MTPAPSVRSTVGYDLFQSRIRLYLKVLFLIHVALWSVSTWQLVRGPGAPAPLGQARGRAPQDGRELATGLSALRLNGWSEQHALEWWDGEFVPSRPEVSSPETSRTQLSVNVTGRTGG